MPAQDKAQWLEARTKEIETSLLPLISQLVRPEAGVSAATAKGKSRSVSYLVRQLIDTVYNFATEGLEIARECSDEVMEAELRRQVVHVETSGNAVVDAAYEFGNEPNSAERRATVGKHAHELLCVVARVLAMADLIDAQAIVKFVEAMLGSLCLMQFSRNHEAFMNHFKAYGAELKNLLNYLNKTWENTDKSLLKSHIISIQSFIFKQSLFLYTCSRTRIKHPDNSDVISNHEQVYKQTEEALKKLLGIFNHTLKLENVEKNEHYAFLEGLVSSEGLVDSMDSDLYGQTLHRSKVQGQLDATIEQILNFSSQNLNDSMSKDRIFQECNRAKRALQNLFETYENREPAEEILDKKTEFSKRTKSLRRNIYKAILEQFSAENHDSLQTLVETAKTGDAEKLPEKLKNFSNFGYKLAELSLLVSSATAASNTDGSQTLAAIAARIRSLIPHVTNTARVLCSLPTSAEALASMDVAREAWTQELKLLTLAIDETVSVNDQLLICEHEILFNLNRSIALLQTGCSTAEFEQTSKQVVKRVARVCELVTGEIGNYEPCEFTARVLESVQVLRNQLMAGFVRCAGHSAHVTTGGQWEVSSGNEFIEHSRLVYDTVRELRQAVIQIPSQNGMGQLGSLVENEIDESTLRENEADRDDEGSTTIEPESVLDDGGNDNDDELDSNTTLIPSASSTTKEQLEEIQQQMAELRQEKTVFDREVLNKWDDTSNDIVVLSKAMCVILMDMGSFTRSRGPYKTLVEVIAAAKKISELGTKLEKLCRELANSCPESQSKKELLDYLKSLVFFCSQMNICVKVKENTIDPDTATTLIITSKNLMNTVVSVVNTSYVASTKYLSKTGNKKPLVQWRMKPPELKPLIANVRTYDTTRLVRKGSKRDKISPIKALSEFQA